MSRIILFIALITSTEFVRADLLHIKDTDDTLKSNNATEITPAESKDFSAYYLTTPGSSWEFGFAFKESPEKFQWGVDVVVENNPREAGHNHNNPPPELFYFPNWPNKKIIARLDGMTLHSQLLDQNQRFIVHLATVNYATRVTARGTYTLLYHGKTLNPTLTHTLDIRIPELEPLPRNDRVYKLTDGIISHPDNHYGTGITITALEDLAVAWKRESSSLPLLEIGNISLSWGGMFDTNADWKTSDSSHSFGIAADIGKRNLSSTERVAIIKLMCGNGFYVFNAIENKKEQYHIVNQKEFSRLKGLKWPVKLPDKTQGPFIDCCAAKPGTPDYQKCTGFSETVTNRTPISAPPLPRD